MAYNGRLRESGRPMRNIRGIAILNSSAVHLLVGPGSSLRSIRRFGRSPSGIGPLGSGAAVISQAVLQGSSRQATSTKWTRPCQKPMQCCSTTPSMRPSRSRACQTTTRPPDRCRCAAAADPRTGRGPVAHAISFLPLRSDPGWRLPRTGSASHDALRRYRVAHQGGSRRRPRAPAHRRSVPHVAATQRRVAVPERDGPRARTRYAYPVAPRGRTVLPRTGAATMILRPRALVAEPSTWLAALICCGLCALRGSGIGPPTSGSAVRHCLPTTEDTKLRIC